MNRIIIIFILLITNMNYSFSQKDIQKFVNNKEIKKKTKRIRINENDTIKLVLSNQIPEKKIISKIELKWKESCIHGWQSQGQEIQVNHEDLPEEKFSYGKNETEILYEFNKDNNPDEKNEFEFILNEVVNFHENCKGSKFKIKVFYSSKEKEQESVIKFYLKL